MKKIRKFLIVLFILILFIIGVFSVNWFDSDLPKDKDEITTFFEYKNF